MRTWLLIISVSAAAVVLAACGGSAPDDQLPPTSTSAIDPSIPTPDPGSDDFNPAPFSTSIPQDDDSGPSVGEPGMDLTLQALGAPIRPSPDPNVTVEAFGGVAAGITMPPPGVAVTGVPQPLQEGDIDPAEQPFSELVLIRAGGPTDDMTEIRFLPDGTVTVNGELSTVLTPQQVIALNEQLNEINILSIEGTFAATFQSQQDYLYVLRVEKGDASRSIRADDSLIPPELRELVTEMLALSQDTSDRPPRRVPATEEAP